MSQSVKNTPTELNNSYAAPEMINQRQRTLETLCVEPGQCVLDVGCGTGFLTEMLAELTGSTGAVYAMDKEVDMVNAAMERCRNQPWVTAKTGDAAALDYEDNLFDVVTCTQVLLYVADVEQAIAEMVRVLKPGGKLAILETDWRTTVMHSNHPALTDKIYRSWDAMVPSPNLPMRLKKLMINAGVAEVSVEGIPLVNVDFDPSNFSVSSLDWMSGNAYKQGAISKEESRLWRDDLASLGESGEYFFCVNRFLFCGVVV